MSLQALKRLGSSVLEVPCVIGGEQIFTDDVRAEVAVSKALSVGLKET